MRFADAKAVAADSIFLAGTVLCLAVLGVAGRLLISERNAAAGPPKPKPVGYTHLHCPACGEEIPYDLESVGRPCQSCDEGTGYVPTVGSLFEGESRKGRGRAVAFVLVLLVLLQALAFLGIARLRTLRKAARDEFNRRLVARCPFCHLKTRYPATMAGSGYRCSRCKTAYALPELAEPG